MSAISQDKTSIEIESTMVGGSAWRGLPSKIDDKTVYVSLSDREWSSLLPLILSEECKSAIDGSAVPTTCNVKKEQAKGIQSYLESPGLLLWRIIESINRPASARPSLEELLGLRDVHLLDRIFESASSQTSRVQSLDAVGESEKRSDALEPMTVTNETLLEHRLAGLWMLVFLSVNETSESAMPLADLCDPLFAADRSSSTSRNIACRYLSLLVENGWRWVEGYSSQSWQDVRMRLTNILPDEVCSLDSADTTLSHDELLAMWRHEQSDDFPSNGDAFGKQLANRMSRAYLSDVPGLRESWNGAIQLVKRRERLEQSFEKELHAAKMAAMKELAYGASHEINNPLANISSRAQTLLRDESDPERRERLAMINSQAFRAHEMIANLMLFAHPPKLEVETISIESVIREACEQIEEQAESQGTKIVVGQPKRSTADQDSAQSTHQLNADRNQLCVLLFCMIRNALEALGKGGTVQIGYRWVSHEEDPEAWAELAQSKRESNQRLLRMEVEDDGPGIPESIRPHIFDPFFSGREAGRGLGFGLSKAWRIVDLHGGSIQAVEHRQDGALIRVDLPES